MALSERSSWTARLRPTSAVMALVALLPAVAVGLTVMLVMPGSVLLNRLLFGSVTFVTFLFLSRQPTLERAGATALYLLGMCILVTPVWLFLYPTMNGEIGSIVGVGRFALGMALASVGAVACAGVGRLIER